MKFEPPPLHLQFRTAAAATSFIRLESATAEIHRIRAPHSAFLVDDGSGGLFRYRAGEVLGIRSSSGVSHTVSFSVISKGR